MADQIEEKYLEGLTFRTSNPKEIEEKGVKRIIHVPVERPLAADDVMSWKDAGRKIVIVTKDGRKHTVEKAGKAKK